MIKVLGSSSKGNCYLIETKDEILILEAGVKFKTVLNEINYDLRKVVGCLITHKHTDHTLYTKGFIDNSIKIYAPAEVIEKYKINNRKSQIVCHKDRFKIGGFNIIAFNNYHTNSDSTECECLGYLIQHKDIGKILFCTDTYKIKPKFNNVDYMLLECNYSYEAIEDKEITEKEIRNLQAHMSLNTLKKILSTWDLTGTKEILLIHLSETNSDPVIFKKEIEELTGIKTSLAKKGVQIG